MDPIFIILIILLGFTLIFVISTYNILVRVRNQVRNAWSQIDVQLKRRYDLIPNLVEMVKDYMEYEQETLQRVIEARNQAIDASGVKEQGAAENMLTGALRQLFALVENYPDLKANQNVLSLQEELTSTENKISFSRQHYNDTVQRHGHDLQHPHRAVPGQHHRRDDQLRSAGLLRDRVHRARGAEGRP